VFWPIKLKPKRCRNGAQYNHPLRLAQLSKKKKELISRAVSIAIEHEIYWQEPSAGSYEER
jgi:hypothetical protein